MQEIIGNLIYNFGDLIGLGEMIFPVLMGLFLFFLLFLGIPVAVALATSGFLFAFLAGEFPLFNLLPLWNIFIPTADDQVPQTDLFRGGSQRDTGSKRNDEPHCKVHRFAPTAHTRPLSGRDTANGPIHAPPRF